MIDDFKRAIVFFCCSFALAPMVMAQVAPSELYQQHCASCHGERRTGLMGPALLPESLERLRKNDAQQVITQGRVATQMPAFSTVLSQEEIAGLTQWIYSPVVPAPQWRSEEHTSELQSH